MKTIQYYKTEVGLLINFDAGSYPQNHHVNGRPLKPTFHPKWFLVEGEQAFLEYSRDRGFVDENRRYILTNPEVTGLPPIIPYTDWTDKYSGMEGLYEYTADKRPLGFIAEEVVVAELGHLKFENIGDPTGFKYSLHGEGWDDKRPQIIDYRDLFAEYTWRSAIVHIDEIVKAMTPEVCWHLNPCSLSSHTSYRIIRAYIKDHINPLYAEVTSDYDFCFTVKKRIRCKPHTVKYQTNFFKSKQRPKFANKIVEYKSISIFEMTSAKDKYSGYTILDGFEGRSLEDLGKNIDAYLQELMEAINEPVVECPKCGGVGSIDIRRLNPNERADLKLKAEAA